MFDREEGMESWPGSGPRVAQTSGGGCWSRERQWPPHAGGSHINTGPTKQINSFMRIDNFRQVEQQRRKSLKLKALTLIYFILMKGQDEPARKVVAG